MARPAIGDRLAVALDDVFVAKTRPADVDAARVNREAVVEIGRPQVARVGLDRHRLDAFLAQRRVAAAKPGEVVDAGNLEPHEVLGVVRDPLSVRLGETDADLGLEVEAVDSGRLYAAPVSADHAFRRAKSKRRKDGSVRSGRLRRDGGRRDAPPCSTRGTRAVLMGPYNQDE